MLLQAKQCNICSLLTNSCVVNISLFLYPIISLSMVVFLWEWPLYRDMVRQFSNFWRQEQMSTISQRSIACVHVHAGNYEHLLLLLHHFVHFINTIIIGWFHSTALCSKWRPLRDCPTTADSWSYWHFWSGIYMCLPNRSSCIVWYMQDGITALDIAIESNDTDMVELLLQQRTM